jgi:DNA-binding response OmpR family regulator
MSRKKILIVDDSDIILKSMSMKLTANGYDVVTAEDGSAAVSVARKEKPDMILLDLSFPPDVAHGGGVAWDGFLIMNWLRRLEEAKDIPIVVISGGEPEQYEARALEAGALSYFHKPINNEELLTVIRQVLGEGATEARTPGASLSQPTG